MKKKEMNELKAKDIKEMEKILSEKKTDIMKTRAQIVASKEKNLKKIKMAKRDISQISTIIREKQIAEKLKDK